MLMKTTSNRIAVYITIGIFLFILITNGAVEYIISFNYLPALKLFLTFILIYVIDKLIPNWSNNETRIKENNSKRNHILLHKNEQKMPRMRNTKRRRLPKSKLLK